MTFYERFRGFVIGLFGIPLALLILACPALDIAKVVMFNHTNGELQINDIEYIYLSFSFAMVVVLFCCTLCSARGYKTFKSMASNHKLLGCLPIIWFIIIVIYTVLTRNELDDVPYSCPSNYIYKSSKIRLACQVRLANLVCMWFFAISILLFSLVLIFLPEVNRDKVDKDDKDSKETKKLNP